MRARRLVEGMIVVVACACRSRGARPDDAVRALDAAASTSASTSASASIAPATESSAAKAKPPRAWFGGPRDRPLSTETVRFPIDGEIEYFHVAASEGVLARIADARIDRMVFAVRPLDYFGPAPSGYARSNSLRCGGFVTLRVLSWSCSDMTATTDLALSAQGMGGAPPDATMSYFTVTFQDPEQVVGENLARADLFREDVADEIEKGCKAAIADSVPVSELSLCEAADDFLVDDDGLTVSWSPVEAAGTKYATSRRAATIRWRAFGKKLRSDGAACSFDWSAPTEEDGAAPMSQDEVCK